MGNRKWSGAGGLSQQNATEPPDVFEPRPCPTTSSCPSTNLPANVHLTASAAHQTHPPPSPLAVTMATLCFTSTASWRRAVLANHQINPHPEPTTATRASYCKYSRIFFEPFSLRATLTVSVCSADEIWPLTATKRAE